MLPLSKASKIFTGIPSWLFNPLIQAMSLIRHCKSSRRTRALRQPAESSPAAVDSKNQPINTVASDDTVNITSTAQDIKNASDASSSATVNETRVAEIKAALQAGDYQIDPDRVADKMMQLDKILPNTT